MIQSTFAKIHQANERNKNKNIYKKICKNIKYKLY